MNKMKFMLFAVAAMAAASCVKETAPEGQDKPASEVNYVQMEFTVDTKTKTAIAEDGKTVLWNTNDKVAVYDNSATASAHINEFAVVSESGSSSAVIQGTVPEDATEFYAYYPYHKNRTFADGVVDAYVDETPGSTDGAFPAAVMMAKADADGNFAFKNVCSHIKFTLAEDMTDIKSIILMGNNAETIAGYCDVAWNNGEPVISPASNAASYAKIEKASGLNPGDYYFSIFPTNFTEGFTIVLTKTDGTQLMKKTTKSYDLSARNTILPMKLLASEDYDECTNYYVKYINGEDITIGGYTFNTTAEKTAVVVSDLKDNTNLSADGLYFVAPATDNVQIRGTHSKYMVIGMEKGCRVPATTAANGGVNNGGNVYLLANLNIQADKHLFYGIPAKFGDIIISDCALTIKASSAPFLFSSGTVIENAALNSICCVDSEFGFSKSESYVINTSKAMTIGNLVIENNVFYPASTTAVTTFRISSKSNPLITNVSIANNTIVDLKTPGTKTSSGNSYNPAALVNTRGVSTNYCIKNNLFVNNLSTSGVTLLNVTESIPTSGECKNNYFYSTYDYRYYITSTNHANFSEYEDGIALSASPLSTLWNPAEGSFGAYTITPVDGEAPTVPVGAQRADMAVVTSSVNSPAADYKTADLGTF